VVAAKLIFYDFALALISPVAFRCRLVSSFPTALRNFKTVMFLDSPTTSLAGPFFFISLFLPFGTALGISVVAVFHDIDRSSLWFFFIGLERRVCLVFL